MARQLFGPNAPSSSEDKSSSHPLLDRRPKPRSLLPPAVVGSIGAAFAATSGADLEHALVEGQVIEDIDPALVDASFLGDRMAVDEKDEEHFAEQIRQQGQLVPVLLRKHPDKPGRYQIAFGHRRYRAAKRLGLKLKAVIRDLTNEQLVVAQGQENAARADLSYIEKAMFAERVAKGFGRSTAMAAIALSKAELSMALKILEHVPADLIEAIGPAPAVGRPRWHDLAQMLDGKELDDDLAAFVQSEEFRSKPSNDRFAAVGKFLRARESDGSSATAPLVLNSSEGRPFAEMREDKGALRLTISLKEEAGFASFLKERLVSLRDEYERLSR